MNVSPRLVSLNVGNSNLDHASIRALAANTTLTFLDVGFNNISPVLMDAITIKLEENKINQPVDYVLK